ncbi:MAG: PAS domain S-box protein [Methylococcaceae bacterium]|nr:PAS domain S-box protein [Methylococcaceae bacterium]
MPETRSGESSLPYVVGIGASAGGLEAIESLFKNMPGDTGLAFVVVQHLSPDHKSLMAELLSKHTSMPVNRIEEGVRLKANNVYLIPPRKNLTLFHQRLLLNEPENSEGLNLPIDIFFRSLAEDMNERAIGIVLSGTGSDGTRGIRAIKEHGGMVMVQDEASAKFDGMPRNAIATGLVDFILPPKEMPRQLLAFVKHPYAVQDSNVLASEDSDLTRIFALLRERHKVDFTHYKPNTVVRRIERRITINQCRDLSEYRLLLEGNPLEISSLYQELLIGVTSFFRDEAVYEELRNRWLEKVLKAVTNEELRVWVPGCSTGEEPYSIAMLLAEHRAQSGQRFKVKIFATDVDQRAVEKASTGYYPESIAADVPAFLLAKYFVRKEDNFQVAQTIREMVVFAQHDLTKDPPFTNIHLLSCRNLLIYLQPILQRKILEFFNFSLVKDGVLLLGTSETIGDMVDYFDLVGPKSKFYRSRGKFRPLGLTPGNPLPLAATTFRMINAVPNRNLGRYQDDRILERFINALSGDVLPFTMLVNDQMEITHVFGDARDYLTYPSGKLISDVSKMVKKELSIPIATGVQKVLKSGEEIVLSNIRLHDQDRSRSLTLQIRPLPGRKGQAMLLAVMLREAGHSSVSARTEAVSYDLDRDAAQRINDLEQELTLSRENLQATVEELETSNEELQATNEELLASNEELQSTNEELQSVNEELHTVNAELQGKITELTLLNSDMHNLFNSTSVATLFLDENLEIRRFTPMLKDIFNIVESDLGRPFFHLSHNLREIALNGIVEEVNRSHREFEQEVQLNEDEWFLLRVLPYAVGKTMYAGVILTFVNISQLKATERSLQRQIEDEKSRLAAFVVDSQDAMTLQDASGTILTWNRGAESLYGWSEAEMLGANFSALVPEAARAEMQAAMEHLRQTGSLPQFTAHRLTRSGKTVTVSASATLLQSSPESGALLALPARDLRAHQESHKADCIACLQRLALQLLDVEDAIMLVDFSGNILAWNKGAERLYEWSQPEASRLKFDSLVPEQDQEAASGFFRDLVFGHDNRQVSRVRRLTKTGRIIQVDMVASVLGDQYGESMAVVTTERLSADA